MLGFVIMCKKKEKITQVEENFNHKRNTNGIYNRQLH